MIEIPCHCGNIIESDLEPEIDLGRNPEIYNRIIEGDFMTFTCPLCGTEIKTETALRLTDAERGLDISFIPELDRTEYLSGIMVLPGKKVAIGYKELVEKIVIAGEKLDDRLIEIIKFNLLEKADSNSVRIFFSHRENNDLIFHIHGLKPDQIGLSRLPETVYTKLLERLDELLENDDIKLFTEGPYVSVSRIYLED